MSALTVISVNSHTQTYIHCTGGGDQTYPQEKEMQKGKMVVLGGLTNIWEKKRTERQREKERYTHMNAEFQRITRRDKKDSAISVRNKG